MKPYLRICLNSIVGSSKSFICKPYLRQQGDLFYVLFCVQFLSEFGDIYNGSDDMLDESSDEEPNEDEDKEDLGLLSKDDLLLRGLQTPPKPVNVMPPILPDML
ncbi:unnamed protein product [Rhizophagus irregularis]|nr:unnamed protein product [Rhizophagus irregularis]